MSHARAREVEVGVRGVGMSGDSMLLEELDHVAPPDTEHRPDVSTAARGHASQAGKTASAHEVEDSAFDHVVSRVSKRDDIRGDSCLRPLQEFVAESARGGLHRTARHGRNTMLGHQLHSQPGALLPDLDGDLVRAGPQRVIEMRGGDIEAELPHGDQQSGRIGPARNSYKHAVSGPDQLA